MSLAYPLGGVGKEVEYAITFNPDVSIPNSQATSLDAMSTLVIGRRLKCGVTYRSALKQLQQRRCSMLRECLGRSPLVSRAIRLEIYARHVVEAIFNKRHPATGFCRYKRNVPAMNIHWAAVNDDCVHKAPRRFCAAPK